MNRIEGQARQPNCTCKNVAHPVLLRLWPALALLPAALASGCDLPGKPNPANRPVRVDQVLSFEPLYKQNCAGCHGADGKLGPAPPLNSPLFLSIVPEAELARVVTEGRPGTPMPAFLQKHGGSLTPEQVDVLVKGIKEHWRGKSKENREPPAYLVDQGASPGNTQHGAAVFTRACAGCHGSHGEGGDMAGAINQPAFLSLISSQALRRYVITGRQDLGMPDYAGIDGRPDGYQPLTSPEIADLVAYISEWKR